MKATVFLVGLVIACWAGAAKADIINGDFTNFTGGLPDNWIANPSPVPGERDTGSPDGSAWNFVPFGRIEQPNTGLTMVEGQTYRVTFLASSPNVQFPAQYLYVRMFDNTSFNLLGGLELTSGLPSAWTSYSFEFTADASNSGHTMYPYIITQNGVTGFDNIHVSSVPEPSTLVFIGSTLSMITVAVWRRHRRTCRM